MQVGSLTNRVASYSPVPSPPAIHPSLGIAESGTLLGHRILLATDGSAESRAASAVVAMLARQKGARPAAVRVFGYVTPSELSTGGPLARLEAGIDAMDLSRHLVQAQLARDVADAGTWPIHIAIGHAARAIESRAASAGASLVVMGLCGALAHGGNPDHHTALHVMKNVEVPVLVTNGSLADLPRRIVVGVDLRESGLRAARAALSLVADGGTLVLTFVQAAGSNDDASVSRDLGESEAFDHLRAALAAPRSLHVETAVIEGVVEHALARFARQTNADLIALGARQQYKRDRRALGPVTSALVAECGRSLLVVPPPVHGV